MKASQIIISIFIIFFSLIAFVSTISAQNKSVGKLNVWTTNKVASREKFDEILPTSYQMRVSKNMGFDRIVFEFAEKEVPEYIVYYSKPPISIAPSHLENPKKPNSSEIIKVKGQAFVMIVFALGFAGKDVGNQISGEHNLTILQDIKSVDWFENFFTFAVGLKIKQRFRVQELSNPTRLVIDFKH